MTKQNFIQNISLKSFGFETLRLVIKGTHCVKSVRIRSNSGPHFPTFGLNTERYAVKNAEWKIQPKCGEIRTRITPNTDSFYAVTFVTKCKLKEHFKFSLSNIKI